MRRFDDLRSSPPESIDALLVTHGHADHATHASTYAKRWRCPIYGTKSTLNALRLAPGTATIPFEAGRGFAIGDVRIRTCLVPHDAPQIAIVFESKETAVGVATDLGHIPAGLPSFLAGCQTLLLESNHDPDMLERGPYPPSVKRRVASSRGHLSNRQAAGLLAKLRPSPDQVVLMHLSEANNSRELAIDTARTALRTQSTRLLAAKARRPLRVTASVSRQLTLEL